MNTAVATTAYGVRERERTDLRMLVILLAHVPVVGLLVPMGYGTTTFALVASLLVAALATAGYWTIRGTRTLSALYAACLMLFSAIMIQAQMGRIEMHFHIFAALALVIIYRDWLPVVVAAGTIALHHLLLTGLQLQQVSIGDMPIMIFNYGCSWSIAFLHAAFVVFESSILMFFAILMGAESRQALRMIEIVQAFADEQDLSGRLPRDGNRVTAESFNGMMEQFTGLISRLREMSVQLRENALTLAQTSESTGRIVQEQQVQTDQAAAATNEMAASIQEVATNAQTASEAATSASQAASEGASHMVQASRLTSATHEALENSSDMVQQLTDKVQAIGAVTRSINDISEQTNLLALNAAIEAARAGEHGRGFAVVADEVRSLSRRTQEFTDQIRSTMDQLQALSEGTLAAIAMGQTRSTESTRAMEETENAIRQIEQAIGQVSSMNYQIASACEEQATTSLQINENIHFVAGRNTDVTAEAGRVREIASDLEAATGQLNELVTRYRL